MQQFFSWSPFDEQPLLDIYQNLLSRQIGAGGAAKRRLVFLTTNAKEQVFPDTKRGHSRKHPVLLHGPTSERDIAEDPAYPWETVVLIKLVSGFIRCNRLGAFLLSETCP